jgi:23S rRNA (adenine2030-N6)-methyltransferase
MKYRHSHHAGNFADVHKHVTLLALLAALKRKDKGFLYLDTHAGRGRYDLSGGSAEAAGGIGRFLAGAHRAQELRDYAALIAAFRSAQREPHSYPGSPLIAASALRGQDRAVFIELQAAEANALERVLKPHGGPVTARVERGDGFQRLRAHLPPAERRGLAFLDPPYEETRLEFERVTQAVSEGLRRFPTGLFTVWYPIKDERTTLARHAAWAQAIAAPTLVSELWLYPRDARVALNGSGLLIVNPTWHVEERMSEWLPELQQCLATGSAGGTSVRMLSQSVA